MAVVLQGLGPDSAACISRYRSLCSEQDFEAVKNFLNELIRQDQEKFLLLIITSKVARIPDKSLEYDIFEYLYGSHQLPLYLRIYANTRCCYKVSNAPDVERADRYLARGYASLHHRQACGSSENSKRDRLHIGFSTMLAMLHVQLTHRRWRDAHALAQGAVGEVGRFPEGGALTGSYYGTNTRIARIIGLNYALDLALDHNLEGATRYAALLRQSFSLAIAKADLNLVRFSEFYAGLPLYRVIAESQARLKEPRQTIDELVNLSVIIKSQGRKKVARLLMRKLIRK
jgi:hypothetical protein